MSGTSLTEGAVQPKKKHGFQLNAVAEVLLCWLTIIDAVVAVNLVLYRLVTIADCT